MLSPIEKKELLDIVSYKQYQSYHPKIKKFLESLKNYKDVGVYHANTFDEERSMFIFSKMNFDNLSVLDIGASIGYFSIAAILHGASIVDAFEGNYTSNRLIELQTKVLNIDDRINAYNNTYDFILNATPKYDVAFCLNVLHHVGRYFGNDNVTINEAKQLIIEYLNLLATTVKFCWFQIGYNWKGEEGNNLFENGSKIEVIDFLEKNTKEHWEIVEIGIIDPLKMQYLSGKNNLKKYYELGEFGNRPLFLLKSKIYNNN